MYFLSGFTLGIGAGIVPGPLLTLVITRTLAGGFRAGQRVAIAPLLTDAPIILISVLLFRALPPWLETALTVVGGCFVIYMGIETLRSARNFRLVELAETTLPASADL
jgi:threonine/homoserine/homoserine lactone efflux protein